jgi:hypothetical protein
VLSNANLKTTIEKLVGLEHVSPAFAPASRRCGLNNSSCQVYLGIRAGETIPFVGDLLFSSTRPTFDSPPCATCTARAARSPSTTRRRGRARRVHDRQLDERALEGLGRARRGAYAARRSASSTTRSTRSSATCPASRSKIDHAEAATPRASLLHAARAGRVVRDEVRGPAGQPRPPDEIRACTTPDSVGIIMSGWLGAANYGVITANKVDAFLRRSEPR